MRSLAAKVTVVALVQLALVGVAVAPRLSARLTGDDRLRARVVVLDVDIPGLNGFDVLGQLGAHGVLRHRRSGTAAYTDGAHAAAATMREAARRRAEALHRHAARTGWGTNFAGPPRTGCESDAAALSG